MAELPAADRAYHYKRFGKIATPAAEEARKHFTKILTFNDKKYNAVMGEIRSETTKTTIISIVFAFILAIVCAIIALNLVKSITKPLKEVTDYTNKIIQGQIATINSDNYPIELYILANGLGSMVEKMRAYTQGVLNSLPMPAMLINLNEKAQWWNAQLTKITGSSHAVSTAPIEVIQVLQSQDAVSLCGKVRSSGQSSTQEIQFDNNNIGQLTATPFEDDQKNLLGILVTCFDITAIRHEHTQVQERSQKLDGLAHEADIHGNQVSEILSQMETHINLTVGTTDSQQSLIEDVSVSINQLDISISWVAQNSLSSASLADMTKISAEQGSQMIKESMLAINAVNEKN